MPDIEEATREEQFPAQVWLVFNPEDMTPHELIEVWGSEESAKRRAEQLGGTWTYDSRDVGK